MRYAMARHPVDQRADLGHDEVRLIQRAVQPRNEVHEDAVPAADLAGRRNVRHTDGF